jgi:RNA methyltransferase, TrmH family
VDQPAPVGARHPSIQRLRRLSRRRAARVEEHRFVLDGPLLLAEALSAGVVVEEVIVEDGVPTGSGPLADAVCAGARLVRTHPGTLSRVTDTTTSQGVAAVAVRPEVPLEEGIAAAAAAPLSLVLVGINDPGNAGTLLRAAEAAGAGAVLFCGGAVDPCNPKCVRASAGALVHVTVAIGGEPVEVLERLAAKGARLAATVVRDGVPCDEADLARPVTLVLGSEAHGLPPSVADVVPIRLSIPMEGRTESLNVAMAGAIVAFEALRQRRAATREAAG